MVSKAFFTGSRYLVEDNDGRQDYLRYDGEKFLRSLATAGQWVVDAPVDADETKTAYLKALVGLNAAYFDAREFEASAKGNFFKHDETAERRFRTATAERLTDAIEELRTFLDAHDALLSVVESTDVSPQNQSAERAPSVSPTLRERRASLLARSDRVVANGWFPVVRAYFYSLTPGENISEGRERRKQRVAGSETLPGLDELLGRFTFEKLTDRDLRRIRALNRSSPGPDTGTWRRLSDRYAWFVERGALLGERDEPQSTATGTDGGDPSKPRRRPPSEAEAATDE